MSLFMYLITIIQLVVSVIFIYLAIKMFKLEGKYQITGIGLGIMSFAFIIKSIFTYFGVYTSSSWGLAELIDLMGVTVIIWSIIKK